MKQQRQRRFKSALNNNTLINFDSNVITPGTEFMIEIDNFLRNQFNINKNILPNKVIYSSHLVKGEGEHKIMEFYRQGEVKNLSGYHIVYGLDADLIMLSLLSPQNKIILYRESMEMVDIDKLKNFLYNKLKTNNAITDFVIMMFLLGNDFLPHIPVLEHMEETINLMLNIYIKGNGRYNFTTIDNQFNLSNFNLFLNELAKEEQNLLINLSNNERYDSTPLKLAKVNGTFNINLYREYYYSKALGQKGKPILF